MTYNPSMRLIAILIALFGGFIIYYGISELLIPSVAQQWTIIGGGFLFGGLFLYAYIGKKWKLHHFFNSIKKTYISSSKILETMPLFIAFNNHSISIKLTIIKSATWKITDIKSTLLLINLGFFLIGDTYIFISI